MGKNYSKFQHILTNSVFALFSVFSKALNQHLCIIVTLEKIGVKLF